MQLQSVTKHIYSKMVTAPANVIAKHYTQLQHDVDGPNTDKKSANNWKLPLACSATNILIKLKRTKRLNSCDTSSTVSTEAAPEDIS